MSQQQVIKELHSIQFALKVQDAILNGYRVTRTFGKPDMQYKAILSKVGGLDDGMNTLQSINYQQNLDLKDVNQLHFALKLQQAILGGYRIKVDKRFGKFGVCWYASLEIGKGQLEELLKEQSEPLAEVQTETEVESEAQEVKPESTDSKPAPKKRTTKQTANKEQ